MGPFRLVSEVRKAFGSRLSRLFRQSQKRHSRKFAFGVFSEVRGWLYIKFDVVQSKDHSGPRC
jgi:hypothetical protein